MLARTDNKIAKIVILNRQQRCEGNVIQYKYKVVRGMFSRTESNFVRGMFSRTDNRVVKANVIQNRLQNCKGNVIQNR